MPLSVRLFWWRGIPIHGHITLVVGLGLASRLAFRPLAWVALLLIVFIHELGHAFLLRRYGIPVLSITLHGFGGECESPDLHMSVWQRSVVAWGGVGAQAALFCVTSALAELGLFAKSAVAAQFLVDLSAFNVATVVVNLLPFGGLDGRLAWRLPWFAFRRAQHAWLRSRIVRIRSREERARREDLH
ncbi:MAG TPA: hypothetical protein VFQ35_04945 [Polyangiaceae bacterium]|nr:hypothetical protein [Polyangiaceae bacterium]